MYLITISRNTHKIGLLTVENIRLQLIERLDIEGNESIFAHRRINVDCFQGVEGWNSWKPCQFRKSEAVVRESNI
jgi:hypothetical protein